MNVFKLEQFCLDLNQYIIENKDVYERYGIKIFEEIDKSNDYMGNGDIIALI